MHNPRIRDGHVHLWYMPAKERERLGDTERDRGGGRGEREKEKRNTYIALCLEQMAKLFTSQPYLHIFQIFAYVE